MLLVMLLGLSVLVKDTSDSDVDVAIVFAVDVSLSVNATVAKMQREGHAAAIMEPGVLLAIARGPRGCIAIAYIEWSGPGNSRSILPWTRVCGSKEAVPAANLIRQLGSDGSRCHSHCNTSISTAIDVASALLSSYHGKASNKLIDISANGANNGGPPLEISRERAIRSGYTINGIAIPTSYGVPHSLADYFIANVIGGAGAFVIEPKRHQDYAEALRKKLIREISMVGEAADR